MRIKSARGYTLLEAAIAMLLTAIMTSAVFSVALTTKKNSGRGLRKLIADQAARQLSEQLKNYVTGSSVNVMPGLSGPGVGSGTTNPGTKWSMTDTTNNITDSCGECYALQAGSHTISGNYLPAWFAASPYNATITYFVDNSVTAGGLTVPNVNITVDWNEP